MLYKIVEDLSCISHKSISYISMWFIYLAINYINRLYTGESTHQDARHLKTYIFWNVQLTEVSPKKNCLGARTVCRMAIFLLTHFEGRWSTCSLATQSGFRFWRFLDEPNTHSLYLMLKQASINISAIADFARWSLLMLIARFLVHVKLIVVENRFPGSAASLWKMKRCQNSNLSSALVYHWRWIESQGVY